VILKKASLNNQNFAFVTFRNDTECARDRDLHEFEIYGKVVNEKLFCIVYKTLYLTLGHHALAGILCLCLDFF
jgi:hypothetical protein